jgi:putative nucleotidyltransferase with HDIG domain
MGDFRQDLKRERDLDVLSTILILGLLITVIFLVYLLATGLLLPQSIPLADVIARVLLVGFVLMVVLYLIDQRNRLRAQLRESHVETEKARDETQASYERLAFAHQASAILTDEGYEEGLALVLRQAGMFYGADVAAVAGADLDLEVTGDISRVLAEEVVTHVALEAVAKAEPLHLDSPGQAGGQAIAVPLRTKGKLKAVLCLWKSSGPFTADQLEGLGLLGRTVELAMENVVLSIETRDLLEGTLGALQFIVAGKRPDYARHSMAVGDLAHDVGQVLRLTPGEIEDLKLAGIIHDVGMLGLAHELGDPNKPLSPEDKLVMQQHSKIGADIAREANFSPDVQAWVHTHHERYDGSGYPDGLAGEQIPLGGRILAACEVLDSMTHRTYHGPPTTLEDAIVELRNNAGTMYDTHVVKALVQVIVERQQAAAFRLPEPETSAGPETGAGPEDSKDSHEPELAEMVHFAQRVG